MSTGNRIPWKEANAIAQDCVGQLAPHCSQIDIAGSIRRRCPTLLTLARLLAPWRTIQRLEVKNKRLRRSNDQLLDMLLACSRNVASDRRLRNCPTHGQQPPNAWGCPECVRELRQEAEQLRIERDAAWIRLEVMNRCGRDAADLWATRDGMTGPLPPLPELLARRERESLSPTPTPPAPQPPTDDADLPAAG